MDNKSRIQANNAELREAIELAENLPDAKEPNIKPLTITENGTYTASGDIDGYSPITVDVASGGDGSLELAFSNEATEIALPNITKIKQYAFL